jgi:FkbM family methyltransferase
MPGSSILTEQLASLGVHLPAWPEEPEGDEPDDWIKRGQAYAEGVRLWRAQLRNAPNSTKRVVEQLLRHQEANDLLTGWDRWLSAAIHPEVGKVMRLDRWERCIELLRDAPFSRAQIVGGLLALADSQQLSGAVTGALRLLSHDQPPRDKTLALCAFLISRLDTSWRLEEAKTSHESYINSVDIHAECIKILKSALAQHGKDTTKTERAAHEAIISCLERLLVILGEDDQWSGIPKARCIQILDQTSTEDTLSFLANNITWPVARNTNNSHARMLVAKILVERGRWEEAKKLNSQAVKQLKEQQETEKTLTSDLDIVRTETELLSHELSIALNQKSLEPPDQRQGDNEQIWQSHSRSQLGQDLWVLKQLDWKQDGFFVEFGATDGVLLSNSWLLEKFFRWEGICAEPNPKLFDKLKKNRSCTLSQACVYRKSGEKMSFVLADAYGGLKDFGKEDLHAEKRAAYASSGCEFQIITTSLLDLLRQHGAPEVIDYLSVDTEGSELAILEGFDWNAYQIRCITVEHNYTKQREGIRLLLESKGYARREAKFDDWYYKDI